MSADVRWLIVAFMLIQCWINFNNSARLKKLERVLVDLRAASASVALPPDRGSDGATAHEQTCDRSDTVTAHYDAVVRDLVRDEVARAFREQEIREARP